MFIVKIPAINGNTKGCERSGEMILKELRKIHVNEHGKEIDFDFLDLEEIHIDNKNHGMTNKLIYENAKEIFGIKEKTIFLGGDQSITFSLARAFFDYCENESKIPCLVVFDAHPDCNEKTDDFPTNEEWLRALIESGFPKENILLVGMRNSNKKENIFLKENKIKTMTMNSLTEDLHESCDSIMEFSEGKNLYVSIDIDVIDPSFAPSTEKKETGGLSGREFLYLMNRINKIKNLRAVDITEINEKYDKEELKTIKLGAKIVAEMI